MNRNKICTVWFWLDANKQLCVNPAAGHAGGWSSAETTHEVLTDSHVYHQDQSLQLKYNLLNIRVEKVVLACGECRMGNSILTTNFISLKRHQEKL